MTLYEVSSEMAAILDAIDEAGGEITDEVAAQLDQLAASLRERVGACVRAIQGIEAAAAAAQAESERLAQLATRRQRQAESLREYVMRCLDATGTTRLDLDIAQVAVRTNPPRVEVDSQDVTGWPPEYVVIRLREPDIKPNRAALLAAYRAGCELPVGVRVVQGRRLVIR